MALSPLIGEMRSRIRFENNNPTRLGGGLKDNYEEYLTTWGKFIEKGGGRRTDGFEQVIESTHSIWVRWQDGMETAISSKTRVVIENRFFAVNSFEKVGQKSFYLYLTLNETKA